MQEQDWGLDPCKVGGGTTDIGYGEGGVGGGGGNVGYGEGWLDEGVMG